jgi:hypothetical protein
MLAVVEAEVTWNERRCFMMIRKMTGNPVVSLTFTGNLATLPTLKSSNVTELWDLSGVKKISAGTRTRDLLLKSLALCLVSIAGKHTFSCNIMPIYAIFITKVKVTTTGNCTIFRHNIHSNFYTSVNIWMVILGNFLNYRTTEPWQKPRTYWICQ